MEEEMLNAIEFRVERYGDRLGHKHGIVPYIDGQSLMGRFNTRKRKLFAPLGIATGFLERCFLGYPDDWRSDDWQEPCGETQAQVGVDATGAPIIGSDVYVLSCTCGHNGCGGLQATVTRLDARVVWSLKGVAGWYIFDRDAYVDAVRRADALLERREKEAVARENAREREAFAQYFSSNSRVPLGDILGPALAKWQGRKVGEE
jgi:hypothetical protein